MYENNWCLKINKKRINQWKEIQRALMYEKKYKDNWSMKINTKIIYVWKVIKDDLMYKKIIGVWK